MSTQLTRNVDYLFKPQSNGGSFDEILSYAAGIIDGEGWIGMARTKHADKPNPYYSLRMKVNMTVIAPVKLMHTLFGGNLRLIDQASYSSGKDNYKAQCQWELNVQEALLDCLTVLAPRLLVKKEHAILGIKFVQTLVKGQKDPELREAFYLKFKDLNK